MAIYKEVVNEVGQGYTYVKIEGVLFDFGFNPYVKVYLKCYTNESYRNMEKQEIAETIAKIDRYYELKAKTDLTQDEYTELNSLVIQELEAFKITEKHLSMKECGVKFTDDIRSAIYDLLSNIPEFQGCTMI